MQPSNHPHPEQIERQNTAQTNVVDAPYYYNEAAPHIPQQDAPLQQQPPGPGVASWFEFSNSGYVKGFLIGAGATLLLTNPAIQKAMVTGAVKLWTFVQGGVEEIKEKVQDIKAEMSQEKE